MCDADAMSRKATVPDAWDDDWEAQADVSQLQISSHRDRFDGSLMLHRNKTLPIPPKLCRMIPQSPRLSARLNMRGRTKNSGNPRTPFQSWPLLATPLTLYSESTEKFHFLEARADVPLKTEFKPSIKVLSRKPLPKVDPVNGMSQLALEDDDDDDEDAGKKKALSPEAQRLKAEREREEKRKKYDEARERLFGSQATSSGASTPGNVTPPPVNPAGKGKSRGRDSRENVATRSKKASNNSPGEQPAEGRRLYDPNYTAKPDSIYIQKRNAESSNSGRTTPGEEQQPIRQPKGPDGSGRGGFGFGGRGETAP